MTNLSVPILLIHHAHLSLSVDGFGMAKKNAFWMRTGVICAPKCLTHRNFGYLQHRETCVTKRMRTRTAPRTSQDRCSYLGFDRKFNCLPAKIPTLNYHLKIVRINFVNEFHMSCKNKFHFSYCDFMEIAWTSPLRFNIVLLIQWIQITFCIP